MEKLKMASVFLAWLTKGMVVPVTEIRSLCMLCVKMLLIHLSINV